MYSNDIKRMGDCKLLRGDLGKQDSLGNSLVVYIDSNIASLKAEPFSGANLNELLSTLGRNPTLLSCFSLFQVPPNLALHPGSGMYPYPLTLVVL